MSKKLSNRTWLRAANGTPSAPVDERMKALVRYLARQAAEADYWEAAEAEKIFQRPPRKEFDP